MSSSNTDLLELLRVLDHPKAVYLIQRRFSRKRPQEKNDDVGVASPILYYDSMVDLCMHCNRTVTLCTSLGHGCQRPTSKTALPHSCGSVSTLQDLINAVSMSSFISVSNISSTALHNILILIEQNTQYLLPTTVEHFLSNIEEYSVKDDWCRFLIDCIKLRLNNLNSRPLKRESVGKFRDGLLRKDEGLGSISKGSQTTPENPEVMIIDDSMEDITDDVKESNEGVDEVNVSKLETAKLEGKNKTEPCLEVTDSPSRAESLTDADVTLHSVCAEVSSEHIILATKIYEEWALYKPAKQVEFEMLCSLSNNEFSSCVKMLDCSKLSAQCITGISKNISSLKFEPSYHSSVALVQTVLLPIVRDSIIDLDQTASRDVVSSLCTLNSAYPDCLTQALFLPLIQHQKFGSFHSSLIVKVFEDSAVKQQLENVWRYLVDSDKESGNAPQIWTEDIVVLVLFLVQQKVTLTPQSVSSLIGSLQRSSANLHKSSKFAKLMVELCKSQLYKELMSQFKVQLLEITEGHKSILKSALLREVNKL